MTLLEIDGVQVNFPFTPYPCQVEYMSKVLTCLQKNQNGVLESPTGTGKTLSLLCASLAWQESRRAQVELNKQLGIASALSSNENISNQTLEKLTASLHTATGASWGSDEFLVPRIIYASRTHSQLSQAVQELKRTAYNSVKSSVIASREQLCIHQQVQKLTNNAAKVQMCRIKVGARQCHFYNNIEEFKKKSDTRKVIGNVVDIEDIIKIGHKTKTCPYYMARELKSDADIVFMPYNYLLDNKSRKAHGVELQGSIIIFDEAHNLEKICEESSSFDLSSLDLATAIEETTKLAEKVAEMCTSEAALSQGEDSALIPEFNLEDVIRLKKMFLDIEEKLDKIEIPSSDGKTLPGMFIFEFLSEVNITWSTKNVVLDVLDKMITFLANEDGSSLLHTKGAGLSKFSDCLKIVFSQEPREALSLSSHQKHLSQHFKVHIQKKNPNNQFKKKIDSWASNANADKKELVLSYWCFSPGHTMKDLVAHGVKVIILTSGTLSPLESFTLEMQIPFPVQLENPHVIQKSQVWLGILCKGPDGAILNSEYKNRSTDEYKKSLGNTIVNFARIVPNGLLVFFPSYPVMESCIEKWKMTNQWNVISQYKPVVVEPKGKAAFTEVMDEFYTKINDPTLNGSIFMAVCRGKVSEGLDFADINGRAVIITGLPYPPKFDAKVRLKMEFLKENKQNLKGLDGNMWYCQQATRAVNQAIGRVIRHNKDYGAIVLCDTRFSSFDSKKSLPLWVRDQAQVFSNFGLALKDVIKFFKEAEKNFPTPLQKPHIPRANHSSEDTSIVSGACFEPSFSRKSQGRPHLPITYERACDVACHIPGLSKTTDEPDSICKEYSQQRSGVVFSKKRSLLEALESAEEKANEDVSKNGASSASEFLPPQPIKRKLPGKQKKIKLKPSPSTEVIISNSETEAKAKVGEMKNKMVVESSQNYVAEVKSVLTADEYKKFSETLVNYKKDRQIHSVVPVLADLFTVSQHKYHLFQKFYRFVRQEDKQYYARTCFEITGLKCSTQSSFLDLHKRPHSTQVNFTQVKAFKKDEQMTGQAVAECSHRGVTQSVFDRSSLQAEMTASRSGQSGSSTGQSTSSTGQSTSTPGADKKEFRGFLPHYKNTVNLTLLKMQEDGQVVMWSKRLSQKSAATQEGHTLWSSDRKNLPQFVHDDRKHYHELVRKGFIDPQEDIFTPDMFVYPKTWEEARAGLRREFEAFTTDNTIFSTCLLCSKPPENGLRHECGAICCFLCWKSQVFEGPEDRKCPYPHCGARVKRKHLRPVGKSGES